MPTWWTDLPVVAHMLVDAALRAQIVETSVNFPTGKPEKGPEMETT